MRVVAKVNEEQLVQLRARLDRFTELLQDNVSDVLEQQGEDAAERMQANHQADAHAIQRYINRTWNLTTSIGSKVTPWEGNVTTLELFADAPYAYDIENGTPHSAPYPFFWQEVYTVQEEALADLQVALDDAVAAVSEATV